MHQDTLSLILTRFDKIDHNLSDLRDDVNNLKQDVNDLRHDVNHLKQDFKDLKEDVNKKIIDVKSQVGKLNTKFNTDMQKLDNRINTLQVSMKPFVSYSSTIVEFGINNAVRDYYSDLTLTGRVTNIKSDCIKLMNMVTGINSRDLLVFHPNTNDFHTNQALTEFDGLFRYEINNQRHLIIVESKMIFTLAHLQHKYRIFQDFQKQLAVPRVKYAVKSYYDVIQKSFGNYHKIIVVYGALRWEIDLNRLFLDDEQIIYDPDGELYDLNLYSTSPLTSLKYSPDINSCPNLHPDVIKLSFSNDIKFVVNTISGFKVFLDINSMHGGNDIDSFSERSN